MKRLLPILSTVAGLALLGVGYWLYDQRARTQVKLRQTEVTLTQKEASLVESEAVRERLHTELGDVQQAAETTRTQLQQTAQDHQRLNEQLGKLLGERLEHFSALQSTKAELADLQRELSLLESSYEAAALGKREAEQALMRRDAKALTRAELEQVMAHLEAQDAERAKLERELAALASDYHQLEEDRVQLAQVLTEHPPEGDQAYALQLADWATDLASQEDALAVRYTEVGEGYARLRDYPRAAKAFERALELQENPELHERLALLYSRYIHNGEAAQQHAAHSAHVPSPKPGDAAKAQQLPRSGWRHVWNWLTQ